MSRPLLLAFACSFFCPPAFAITVHIAMTQENVTEGAVTIEPLDQNTTRFTIRISMENDPKSDDPRGPFVRVGSLDVRGEHGQIVRCSIHPKQQGQDLLYTFDLQNELAKSTCFVLVEHFDDNQIGGGGVYRYRLIDFIDPGYRGRELIQSILP